MVASGVRGAAGVEEEIEKESGAVGLGARRARWLRDLGWRWMGGRVDGWGIPCHEQGSPSFFHSLSRVDRDLVCGNGGRARKKETNGQSESLVLV